MLPSFLKKQRKQRDRHSPPGSPGSFFSPSLERSPDVSSAPPLPPFPTFASSATAPSSFPYNTHLPWPPPQTQAQTQPPPRPPALQLTTAASAATTTPAGAGLGSPEIQLDLGFTSESLFEGFTGFFDRSGTAAPSVRTGSPAPAPPAPGMPRPAEPPNMSKPTPPTPTLTPSTATATAMPVSPSRPRPASGVGTGAGTGTGTSSTRSVSRADSGAGSRAASRSRSDALAPLRIPAPSTVSKTLPTLVAKGTAGLSLLPLSLPLQAPSPTSPHAPSPSPSSADGVSQYSYSSGSDDPNAVYTDSDSDAYSASDSAWSYASAPDLDWGLSPGVSFASARRAPPGAGSAHPEGRQRRRRTSTGSVEPVSAWRPRNSHRLTRQDSATLPFDPVREAFFASLDAPATAGGKRSRRNSEKRVSRRASEHKQSRRGSRHSRKSRPASAGAGASLAANSGGSVPASATGAAPSGSMAGLSPKAGVHGSGSASVGTGMALTPVEPMPEDAAAVVRASGGGAGGAQRRRSTKRRSPGGRRAAVGKTPPVSGGGGAASVGSSPGAGAAGAAVVGVQQYSPQKASHTHSAPDANADADADTDADADAYANAELTFEDALTGTNGYTGMDGAEYDRMGLGMGTFGGDMGPELDAVSKALFSGGAGLDGIMGRLRQGQGWDGAQAAGAGGASGAGPSGPSAHGSAAAAAAHASPVPPHTAPLPHGTPSQVGRAPPRLPPVQGVQELLGRSRSAQATVGTREEGLRAGRNGLVNGTGSHGTGIQGKGVNGHAHAHAGVSGAESGLGLSGMGGRGVALGRGASASAVVSSGNTSSNTTHKQASADGGGSAASSVRPLPPSPAKDPQHLDDTHSSPPRQRTAAPLRPLPASPNAGMSVDGGDTNSSRPRSPFPTRPAPAAQNAQPSAQYPAVQSSPPPPPPVSHLLSSSSQPAKPPPPPALSHHSQGQSAVTAAAVPTQPTPFNPQRRSFSAPEVSSTPPTDPLPDSSATVTSLASVPIPAAGMGTGMGMGSASPVGGKFMHPPRPVETFSVWKNKSAGDVSQQTQAQAQTPSLPTSTSTRTQTPTPRAGDIAMQSNHVPQMPTSPPGSGYSTTSNYSISSFPIVAATADGTGTRGPGMRRMSANQASESRGASPAPSYQLSETSSTASTTSLVRLERLPIGNGNVSKTPATAVERLQQRARADREPYRINTAPLNNSNGSSDQPRPYPTLLHRELSTKSAAFPETPHEFSPLISPVSAHTNLSSSPASLLLPSRRIMPKAPMIDPAPPPKRRSRPPLPIGPRKPSVRVAGAPPAGASLGGVAAGLVHGLSSSSSSSVSLVTTNTSVSGAAAATVAASVPVAPAATGVTRGSSVRNNSNGSSSAGTKPTAYAPSSPKFQTRPVRWRGLTMDAAKWTLTSGQLQDIVGRAIRQSAEASSIRLLTLDVFDREIPEEIRRLEMVRDEIKSKYRGTVRRRRMLFRSVTLFAEGNDSQTRARLAQELVEVSITCDTLTDELFRVMDELQQLNRLRDVHSASALAMALRKLNSSFLKQSADAQEVARHVSQLEAEREEAWATAERVEHDLLDLQAKMDALTSGSHGLSTPSSTSNRSSRVSAARKTSIRASKASLRLSRGAHSSHSSTSSQRLSAFAPPVPPVPRLPYPSPHIQALPLTLSLNTDIPASSVVGSPYSRGLSSAMVTGGSPTPEALALLEAQNELCDMLGISRADLRRTRSGRSFGYNNGHQRPASELSPISMPGSPFPLREASPLVRAMTDMLATPGPVGGRKRNASFSAIPRPADSIYMDIPEV